jgi:hypothetical protein
MHQFISLTDAERSGFTVHIALVGKACLLDFPARVIA